MLGLLPNLVRNRESAKIARTLVLSEVGKAMMLLPSFVDFVAVVMSMLFELMMVMFMSLDFRNG